MHEALNQEQFVKPTQDYLRVATVSTEVAIADIVTNVETIGVAYQAAKDAQAEILVTPELSITGYSTADLFHYTHVLEQTEAGLNRLAAQTMDGPALVVGAPLRHEGKLYNCAIFMGGGDVQGVVPKVHLPNYKEFYEQRWFSSGKGVVGAALQIAGHTVPFGTDLLFQINGTKVAAEICEDMFAAHSPGTDAALADAQLIVNPSASDEIVGKLAYRRNLVSSFAGKAVAAYAYTSVGAGESVADVTYGGHQMINETGRMVAERKPYDANGTTPLVYDIDRTYIEHDRVVNTTWAKESSDFGSDHKYRLVDIVAPQPTDGTLLRKVDPLPFVPANPETLNERCEEIFGYMARALAQCMQNSYGERFVLGLSGGLDSTLALLTCTYACDILGKPYSDIYTITMPAHASSERTQDNATQLAEAFGTTHKIIPIVQMATAQLHALGHDGVTEDLTFENTHARTRTELLMNTANFVKGFVVGTGDMSEIAKGWSTYNGDHMSMFNPNSNVPKTLVGHLVRWYAGNRANNAAAERLHDILETPISPELTGDGDLSQTTEDLIGPYDLSDFFMYELLRNGSRPRKLGYLALEAFEDKYTPDTVAKWLAKFLTMYTGSQWKREAAPNGTKFGTTALSQRGDHRMAPNTSRDWFLEFTN